MTPPPEYSELRRSFVKKTLAPSVSISFAGLIRAHGEEGGGTTTWNADNTAATTTDSGGTTIWNPDETVSSTTFAQTSTTWEPYETTVVATIDGLVSLQKQQPYPANPPDRPEKRTQLRSPAGTITVFVGGKVFFELAPDWGIEVIERVVKGPLGETVSEDCASYVAETLIGVDILGAVNIPDAASLQGAIHEAVTNGFGTILNPASFPGHVGLKFLSVPGPSLCVGYSVAAAWGYDYRVPGQMGGPLVTVGDRLGTVSTSSHGFWLSVDSELSPVPPAQSVDFNWKVLLRRSGHIAIERHIQAEILNQLNAGVIQDVRAANPGAIVTGDCQILPPPQMMVRGSFVQPVVAFSLPPTSNGQSCVVIDPNTFGANSGLLPLDEDLPDDPQWEKDEPAMPPCPPIEPIAPIA